MIPSAGLLSRRVAFAGLEMACLLATGCVRPRATASDGPEGAAHAPEGAPAPTTSTAETSGADGEGQHAAAPGSDPQGGSASSPPASGPPIAGAPPAVGTTPEGAAPQSARAPGQVEALRMGSEVLMLEPRGTWTVLAATHTVAQGRQVRVVLRSEVDPFGPRTPAAVAWVEASAPLAADQLVGTWAVSGSIPSPGGAIGWRREYRLTADGRYTFSAYPALTGEGTWTQREPGSPFLVFGGVNQGEGVLLRRDPTREPSEPGPLANEAVQVTQTDASPPPIPSDAPTLDPSVVVPSEPPAPPRTMVTELHTDADGTLRIVVAPWARQLILVDQRQRRVQLAL
ncbi:MAG: hypothetical protein R3B40_10340 [Polyangiales bacterium]